MADSRPAPLTREQERKLFSMLWRINDALHHDHNGCRFDGSSNDIDDFRDMLHEIDPLYQRQHRHAAKSDLGN